MQPYNRPKDHKSGFLKSKVEAALVGVGMTIGFSTVMMKLSDVWPCDILEMLNIALPSVC